MFQPKLGVSLHTLSSKLTPEVLAALGRSRIATLELTAALFTDDPGGEIRSALRETLRASGTRPMTVHALFGGAYDASVLDEAARGKAVAASEGAVQLAVEFGAPMVVVHASAEPIGPGDREARLEQARLSLAEIGRRCEAAGKRVAVELLPRTCLGNTVDELLALLEGLPESTFGVCLDTNHLMGRWASLGNEIRRLGDRLITTHLSDYDGVDEKHQVPGEGVLDWASAMAALREIGYAGPFNYECRPPGDSAEERIHALEANFAWLSAL